MSDEPNGFPPDRRKHPDEQEYEDITDWFEELDELSDPDVRPIRTHWGAVGVPLTPGERWMIEAALGLMSDAQRRFGQDRAALASMLLASKIVDGLDPKEG